MLRAVCSTLYRSTSLPRRYTLAESGKGCPQHVHESGTIMLISDLALLEDPKFKVHVERYAKDQQAYFDDFAAAWVKLQENGCSGLRDAL